MLAILAEAAVWTPSALMFTASGYCAFRFVKKAKEGARLFVAVDKSADKVVESASAVMDQVYDTMIKAQHLHDCLLFERTPDAFWCDPRRWDGIDAQPSGVWFGSPASIREQEYFWERVRERLMPSLLPAKAPSYVGFDTSLLDTAVTEQRTASNSKQLVTKAVDAHLKKAGIPKRKPVLYPPKGDPVAAKLAEKRGTRTLPCGCEFDPTLLRELRNAQTGERWVKCTVCRARWEPASRSTDGTELAHGCEVTWPSNYQGRAT